MKTPNSGSPVARLLLFHVFYPRLITLTFIALLLLSACTNSTEKSTATTDNTPHDFAYSYNSDGDNEIYGFNQTPSHIQSLDQMASLTTARQTFTVKNNADTVIVGKKGVKVFIPAGSLALTDDKTPVEFELKEYNNQTDFLLGNLTTSSNGKVLESGGTVYINATCNGKKVDLKNGKQIQLAFPNAKPKPNMQTFYGDANADGNVNWQTANVPAFNNSNNSFNRVKWVQTNIEKIRYKSRSSSVTTARYQIQAYGSNNHCTEFTDTCDYKNVLDYFQSNLKISESDFKMLQGVYFIFTYQINGKGVARNKQLYTSVQAKNNKNSDKARRLPLKKFQNEIKALLDSMPDAEPSKYLQKEILRIYIDDFEVCRTQPMYSMRNNALKEDYTESIWHPDTIDAVAYQAWQDSVRKAAKTQQDYLMKTNGEYYFLNSGRLGWINCDRFSNQPMENVIVKVDYASPNVTVKVVFKGINSLMPLYGSAGKYTGSMPVGRKVKYFVFDKRADGMYFAVKDAVINSQPVSGFEFQPLTVDAIDMEMEDI